MWRAKTSVAGTPIAAPIPMDQASDNTGRPTQLPMREAKKTFTAMAPAPNG